LQVKKTIPFIILVFVLLVIALFFVSNDRHSTIRVRDRVDGGIFTHEITSIALFREDDSLLLHRCDEGWTVNQRYPADVRMVNYMINCLKRIRILSPVGRGMAGAVNDSLEQYGIRLQVFSGRKRIANMLVMPHHDHLTMRKYRSSKPFITGIIGAEGYRDLFFSGVNDWRDKALLAFDPPSIRSVQVEYPGDTAASFTLRREGKSYVLLNSSGKETMLADTGRAVLYLSYFYRVEYLSFITPGDDQQTPVPQEKRLFCIIRVTDTDGHSTTVELYHKPMIDSRNGVMIDPYRLISSLGDGTGFVVARYMDVDPLLKRRTYFTGS